MDQKLKKMIDDDIQKLNKNEDIDGRIGELIGTGAFGFVCEWKDGKNKVIKVLDPFYHNTKNSLSKGYIPITSVSGRFLKEFDTSSKLAWTKHRNLMPLMDSPYNIELDGREISFIVMPKLSTIEELPQEKGLIEEQAVKIVSDCCDALHVLHREPEKVGKKENGIPSIIHCDIKPNNIFYYKYFENGTEVVTYIVGDYSSCFLTEEVKGLDLELLSPSCSRRNPYFEPTRLCIASDIWSLGWVLWYWLNGKVHPTEEDINSRKLDQNTNKPKLMELNCELWDVFLKMTNLCPEKRYQSVDTVKAALKEAMEKRDKRLKKEQSAEDRIIGALVTGCVTAGLYLLKKRDSNIDRICKEEALPCGGSFSGKWKNGEPYKGTYTSPTGKKKTGKWMYKEKYREKASDGVVWIFSGLINTDNKWNDYYQGDLKIEFPWGSYLELKEEDGDFTPGTMYFANGEKKFGTWIRKAGNDYSVYELEEDDKYYACGSWLIGNAHFEGDILRGEATTGKIYVQNHAFSTEDMPTFKTIWDILLDIQKFGGCFEGDWSDDGTPTNGIYKFSTGDKIAGKFQYAFSLEIGNSVYSGMTMKNKACGFGKLKLGDWEIISGEFKNNRPHGKGVIMFPKTGTKMYASFQKGCITFGRLIYADGREKQSDNWINNKIQLTNGDYFEGILSTKDDNVYGIGKVTYMSSECTFEGELYDGAIAAGTFKDKDGNFVTK